MSKNYAALCEEADAARRKKHGWCGIAWVGINYAQPRDEHERWALDTVKAVFPNSASISMYQVVELLAQVRKANR